MRSSSAAFAPSLSPLAKTSVPALKSEMASSLGTRMSFTFRSGVKFAGIKMPVFRLPVLVV